MARLRESIAGFLALTLFVAPTGGVSASPFGAVLSAVRAHVGTAAASAGATVFGGDRLSTEQSGNIQVRTGAARFMLAASSSATLSELDGAPSATLLAGTAIFSTAAAKAFTLLAAKAEIRPRNDGATIAQVSIENPKQLLVRSTRGELTITFEGETQIIPEGAAYRVILDPESLPDPQGPRGAGTKDYGKPRKAAKSRFMLFSLIAIGGTIGGVTAWAVHEAWESPDRP